MMSETTISESRLAEYRTDFDRFVAKGELHPVYQPIVDLVAGGVVGFEALARWPNLYGATPDVVFAEARNNGRTAELDWACRLAALAGAIDFGLGRDHVLFVNVEPDGLGTPVPSSAVMTLAGAKRGLRVMIELTERSLARRPAELLRLVEWARRHEWGIALDDVGADPESLALLPFLAPDVVKLDMTLIRQRPNPQRAAIMAAVMAHSERTGAIILAEGIETPGHLDQALALGATLGQGWLLGRPGPLVKPPTPKSPIVRAHPNPPIPVTPFAMIEGREHLRIGRKGLLLGLSRHIETQGLALPTPPVVLGAFQTAARFTTATATRYSGMAARCPLVAALGLGLAPSPAPGVHGAALSPTDPLVGEWTVTVVGSHYSGALIARDLGDDGPEHDRRFEFVVTHDRDLVLGAARSLMSRITMK
jgi:EAL domain-containing protein (putative c-di-GMP-specific phosphodiesterase class I)